jgi:uroporphyrinogen decarboxylase
MNSKERVLAAVEHRPYGLPVDFWATPETRQHLLTHLNLADGEALLQALGVDIRVVGPKYTGPELKVNEQGELKDVWGVVRKKVKYDGGYYWEVCHSPLAEVTEISELECYPWPDPEWYDYDEVARQAEKYPEYAIINTAGRLNRTSLLHAAMYLRGMDLFMLDLALRPELARAILQRVGAYYLAHNERIFKAARGLVDIFMLGDDFGGQEGLLVSLAMWREFFAPGLGEFMAQAKSFGLKVMFHSCGSIKNLIPDLIGLGVDILNPIQVRASNMEPAVLKAEFGEKIAFHGAIDIQETLPRGTVDEVRAEVRRMKETLGPTGYILAPTHNIQVDTPVENILVMYEEAKCLEG